MHADHLGNEAPEGDVTKPIAVVWTWIRHRLEYGLVRTARAIDRLLGPRRSAAVASALGRFVYRRLRIRADVVEDQLRHAFPDRDDAWIRRVAEGAYEHLAREAMMLIRLSRLGREAVLEATELEGEAELRSALAEGKGALIVSGHLGNWEIGGSGVAVRGYPMDAVARRQANPIIDRMVNRARERLGMRIISMGGATKQSLRALREGRTVGLVADQDARARGVFVPFFGRAASTFRGPAVLALRSGAPVLAASAVRRDDGRYRIRLRRVPIPEAATDEEREWALTAALAAALEAAIREHPSQYLWHHRRWKTRPPDEGDALEPGNGAGGATV